MNVKKTGNKETVVTVYVTRYALTEGIFKAKANLLDDGKYAKTIVDNGYGICLGRSDYALTPEDANAQAEVKLAAKLNSLTKAIEKLKRLSFRAEEL